MYANGKGLPADNVAAHMWANIAEPKLRPGEERDKAIEIRTLVEGRMTPEQIAEARRMAREWRPMTSAK
jgi:hypothetical protein